MRAQSLDTTLAFERVQIARIRSFSPAKKFASVRSWTHSITSANLRTSSHLTEPMSERDRAFHFLLREYGKEFAFSFQHALETNPHWNVPDPDIQFALLAAVEAFEYAGIPYALGGSLACSIYGFPRSAQDVDLHVDLCPEHLASLITRLHQDFVFNEQHVMYALEHSSCFSLLHLASLVKIDILLSSCSFEAQAFQRKQALHLIEGRPPLWILCPEDVALMRLVWYDRNGAKADDQWNDVLGLLKIQAPLLNLAYLERNAVTLHVADLVEQGLIDAGIHEAA